MHIDQTILSRLKKFENNNGHNLRILHIGNIANNAYYNAKILNRIGLDCDVLCYDYYHIMGCPEWEDADFTGEIGNQFYPAWAKLDLKGYQRPEWFVQGPFFLCIRYLLARRYGKHKREILWWKMLKLYRSLLSLFGRPIDIVLSLFLYLLFLPYSIISIIPRYSITRKNINKQDEFSYRATIRRLIIHWKQQFTNRSNSLSSSDFIIYRHIVLPLTASLWRNLFSQYDIIIGYASDPILPLISDIPYFAMEHGTLRELPFLSTPLGRATALSYNRAKHVFVTNPDCLNNARNLAGDRVSLISHPYDEGHTKNVSGFQEYRRLLIDKLDSDFFFLFPTRHDWIPGKGFDDKANDVFLRAFCVLRKQGLKVGMICCNWGHNVSESKSLLKKQGCEKNVLWKNPMGAIEFARTAKSCHVVVDQFKLGGIGGIMFKSMALGLPVLTYIDKRTISSIYKEMPPIINCHAENEIIEKIKNLFIYPEKLKELSTNSQCWIEKHYNSISTVNTQLRYFMKYLDSSGIKV